MHTHLHSGAAPPFNHVIKGWETSGNALYGMKLIGVVTSLPALGTAHSQ